MDQPGIVRFPSGWRPSRRQTTFGFSRDAPAEGTIRTVDTCSRGWLRTGALCNASVPTESPDAYKWDARSRSGFDDLRRIAFSNRAARRKKKRLPKAEKFHRWLLPAARIAGCQIQARTVRRVVFLLWQRGFLSIERCVHLGDGRGACARSADSGRVGDALPPTDSAGEPTAAGGRNLLPRRGCPGRSRSAGRGVPRSRSCVRSAAGRGRCRAAGDRSGRLMPSQQTSATMVFVRTVGCAGRPPLPGVLASRAVGVVLSPGLGSGSRAAGGGASQKAAEGQPKRSPLSVTSGPSLTDRTISPNVPVPGHWEGDLIIGAADGSAVVTLTEPVTRHTLPSRVAQRLPRPRTPPRTVSHAIFPRAVFAAENAHLESREDKADRVRHRKPDRSHRLFLRAPLALATVHQPITPTACSAAGIPKAPTSTSANIPHNQLTSNRH